MSGFPRTERMHALGQAAAARVHASGGCAMDAACAAIETSFGPASIINSHKRRVERLIRLSFGHPEVRARFRYYIDQFTASGVDLDAACALLRDECRASHPRERGVRLPSMVRAELHLILRWLRAKRMHRDFADMIEGLSTHRRRVAGAIHQGEHLEAAE